MVNERKIHERNLESLLNLKSYTKQLRNRLRKTTDKEKLVRNEKNIISEKWKMTQNNIKLMTENQGCWETLECPLCRLEKGFALSGLMKEFPTKWQNKNKVHLWVASASLRAHGLINGAYANILVTTAQLWASLCGEE